MKKKPVKRLRHEGLLLPKPNAKSWSETDALKMRKFIIAKEYELLDLFMRHPRQVLTREMIFDRVWGYDFGGQSNVLEVYIRYLRQKLEEGDDARLIQTVRGVGYVLRETP